MRRRLGLMTAALLSIYTAQAQKLSLRRISQEEYQMAQVLEKGLTLHSQYATQVEKEVTARRKQYTETRKQLQQGKIEWAVAKKTIAGLLIQQGIHDQALTRRVKATRSVIARIKNTPSTYDDKYLPELRDSLTKLENAYVDVIILTSTIDLEAQEWLTPEKAKEINSEIERLEKERMAKTKPSSHAE